MIHWWSAFTKLWSRSFFRLQVSMKYATFPENLRKNRRYYPNIEKITEKTIWIIPFRYCILAKLPDLQEYAISESCFAAPICCILQALVGLARATNCEPLFFAAERNTMKVTPEILKALNRAKDYYGNTTQLAKHLGIAHSTILFWFSG